MKIEAERQLEADWKLYQNPPYKPTWCQLINFGLIGITNNNGTKTWLGVWEIKIKSKIKFKIKIKYRKHCLLSLTNSGIENNENAKLWWTFRHIEYNPIIQNEWPDKLKNQLHSALEICWWPGLRLGNWHEYQKALNSYIASGSSAHILLGGTIRDKIPEELVTITIESYCHLYIYEYVEPLNSHEQPVFIFGYNSPFADFYDRSSVVFCRDICSEIPWLRTTWQTFNYSTMGIMFCCTVDDVKQTNLHLHVDEVDIFIYKENILTLGLEVVEVILSSIDNIKN
uniref:Uncharacterized protein n=1 Tax=Glossina pallidipes TaxID=7398 RepID=A0A1A9ZG86_GLOPL